MSCSCACGGGCSSVVGGAPLSAGSSSLSPGVSTAVVGTIVRRSSSMAVVAEYYKTQLSAGTSIPEPPASV